MRGGWRECALAGPARGRLCCTPSARGCHRRGPRSRDLAGSALVTQKGRVPSGPILIPQLERWRFPSARAGHTSTPRSYGLSRMSVSIC